MYIRTLGLALFASCAIGSAHATELVVIVSARHEEVQKVVPLNAGAEDYLVKPFGVGEHQARIRVALRHRGTPLKAVLTRHAIGNLNIDVDRWLVEVAGSPVHLTRTKFTLLARLVRSAPARW